MYLLSFNFNLEFNPKQKTPENYEKELSFLISLYKAGGD